MYVFGFVFYLGHNMSYKHERDLLLRPGHVSSAQTLSIQRKAFNPLEVKLNVRILLFIYLRCLYNFWCILNFHYDKMCALHNWHAFCDFCCLIFCKTERWCKHNLVTIQLGPTYQALNVVGLLNCASRYVTVFP